MDDPSPHFDLDAALGRVARWLPTQGPIKDFVHHNTLHALEATSFHDAVAAAASVYGARRGMSLDFFASAYREGRITDAALERALAARFPDGEARSAARATLFTSAPEAADAEPRSDLRALWTERLGGVPLHRRSHLHLFRLFGSYLDQGLSTWRMPGADRTGLYQCVARLVATSALPLVPFDTKSTRELLALPARDAIVCALAKTVGREELYEPYLLETLLALRGWAGLIGECERHPTLLLEHRDVTLLDCAALTLVAELGCLARELGEGFAPIASAAPDHARKRAASDDLPLRIWQEAFEWSYYEPLLGALIENASRATAPPRPSAVWAVFCLDDRSCSIRRHLEEIAPGVTTFGTAGFFGLDFLYRGAGDAIAGKHCPAPVTPRHLVVEREEAPRARRLPFWRRALHLESHPNTLLGGWLLSYALGLGAAARLAANVFRPSLAPLTVPPLSTVHHDARFMLLRDGDARTPDGLWLGYSIEELADRVAGVLRSMGADRDWPGLVVLFGHGASSVNNPYFAAYNCGACSGRAGAPNARAFAMAANDPDVRAALATRGLAVPDSTLFVGALYDTTRDEATFFDVERVPERFTSALSKFRARFDESLGRNAVERCRRFDSARLAMSPERALEHVRLRSTSLFEPRPEYNHATNASLVVGRRALTSGLFLDRRAFLTSYDPESDPSGELLAEVLSAVIPVCAGINLEYFFSRIDPRVYGAGTKLPHNVNGLVGVCNGIEGDLLTGLPTQMTEIHDPLRLLVVVEQSPAVALAAARRSPSNWEVIENEWVHYGCIDPATREVSVFQAGAMVKLSDLPRPTRRWRSSLDAAREGRGNLPIGFVGRA